MTVYLKALFIKIIERPISCYASSTSLPTSRILNSGERDEEIISRRFVVFILPHNKHMFSNQNTHPYASLLIEVALTTFQFVWPNFYVAICLTFLSLNRL